MKSNAPPPYVLNFTSTPLLSLVVIFSHDPPPPPPPSNFPTPPPGNYCTGPYSCLVNLGNLRTLVFYHEPQIQCQVRHPSEKYSERHKIRLKGKNLKWCK